MYRLTKFIVGSFGLDSVLTEGSITGSMLQNLGITFPIVTGGPQLSVHVAVSQRYLWYWLQLQKEEPLDCEINNMEF
jgi:hypothetical protein